MGARELPRVELKTLQFAPNRLVLHPNRTKSFPFMTRPPGCWLECLRYGTTMGLSEWRRFFGVFTVQLSEARKIDTVCARGWPEILFRKLLITSTEIHPGHL